MQTLRVQNKDLCIYHKRKIQLFDLWASLNGGK